MDCLNLSINVVSWQEAQSALRDIREIVFIKEQHVPVELEWDELDINCQHILASSDAKPIGTGRLTEQGHIGRMAVLKSWRRQGVGSAILCKLIDLAHQKQLSMITLNAQIGAEMFYKKHDFRTISGVFDDAGIPHVKMVRKL